MKPSELEEGRRVLSFTIAGKQPQSGLSAESGIDYPTIVLEHGQCSPVPFIRVEEWGGSIRMVNVAHCEELVLAPHEEADA